MKRLLILLLLFSYNISFASNWLTIPQEENPDIFYLFTFDNNLNGSIKITCTKEPPYKISLTIGTRPDLSSDDIVSYGFNGQLIEEADVAIVTSNEKNTSLSFTEDQAIKIINLMRKNRELNVLAGKNILAFDVKDFSEIAPKSEFKCA